jgi:hypothetical protein
MEKEMKNLFLVVMMLLFPISQALASDGFDGFDAFDSIESKTMAQILRDCPVGPYPIQPIGPIAGTMRYKTLNLSGGPGSFTNVTVTVWRYPCSREVSVPVATVEPHGGRIPVQVFTLKETGSQR